MDDDPVLLAAIPMRPEPESTVSPVRRHYAAFISYRHADNREEGRRWAEWLHHALETYDVPRGLIGTTNKRGQPVAASLYPVFRDEEELPADADLSLNIRQALENSATLIVICSPGACVSRFVADEIKIFKELGKSDRVFALLVDGEPNVSDDEVKRSQFGIGRECLPECLRYGVATKRPDATSQIEWSARAEPLAADVRPGGRAEQGYTSASAYREFLESKGIAGPDLRREVREYGDRLNLARLKLIAGTLGLPLGTLRNRDAIHRARKARRLTLLFGVIAAVTMLAGVVAVVQARSAQRQRLLAQEQERLAQTARKDAQQQESVARARLSDNYLDRALALLKAGDRRQGTANLVAALRANPDNSYAADRLLFELYYGDWLVPVMVLPLPAEGRDFSRTYEETSILGARLVENKYIEANTIDFDGRPARVFRSSVNGSDWVVAKDKRKLRSPGRDYLIARHCEDYEVIVPEASPDFIKLKQLVPRPPDFPPSLSFSRDRRWAAWVDYNSDAYPSGLSPVALLDWANAKLIKPKNAGREITSTNMTTNVKTVENWLFGLPAFDSKHSLLWVFNDGGGSGPVLEAVDLIGGNGVLKRELAHFPTLTALRPRVAPDGNLLTVRFAMSNRPGEVLNIFQVNHGKELRLNRVASNVPLPGMLTEVSSDARRMVSIVSNSIVVYDLLEHMNPDGLAATDFPPRETQPNDTGRIEALTVDGKLKAVGNTQGHFIVSDATSGTSIATFESQFYEGVDGSGRFVRHAEFSPDSRWLLVWGSSEQSRSDDTEIYDPRSGRLLYPRLSGYEDDNQGLVSTGVRKVADDGHSLVLLNGQNLSLRFADGSMPEKFAQLAEAIIGGHVDERGVYHVTGVSDADPWATVVDIQEILDQLDPSASWTKFAKQRFSAVVERAFQQFGITRHRANQTPENTQLVQQSPSADLAVLPGERYPETRLRRLAAEDVKEWSIDKLQYAINEIYARHGAAFPNQKFQRSFNSFSWYRPQPDKSVAEIETLFADIERQNVEVLGAARNSKKAPTTTD